MHIVIVHQYHHNPDCPATCRHYTFMAELVKRHQITLVTSNAWESKRLTQLFDWVPPGVNLISIEVPYHNKMGIWRRVQAFGSFALQAIREARGIKSPDVIWGVSTPLTTAWAASKIAGYHRVPWVFEVQDLWPSFPIQMGAIPFTPVQQQLYRLEKSLYRKAAHIIPLSPDMETYILEKGVSPTNVTTLVNGTDLPAAPFTSEEREEFARELGLAGKQIILYAGTYGRANDIPMLVEAARLCQDSPHLHFVFAGQGFDESLLQAATETQPNMTLLPPQPRHQVAKLFGAAAVSVVSFIDLPVLKANSPGKLFDSLAVGTPVIVTNPGWTKELVESYGCGWYVPAGDAAALAASLRLKLPNTQGMAEMRLKAAEVARRQFDRKQMVPVLEQIFEKVVQNRKR